MIVLVYWKPDGNDEPNSEMYQGILNWDVLDGILSMKDDSYETYIPISNIKMFSVTEG